MTKSSIVYLKTGGETSVNVESEGRVVVRPKIVRPVTQPPTGSISSGQLATVNSMIDEWVSVSGLVGGVVNHGGAKKRFLRQAVSMGKDGAPYMSHFPACDFERGMKFLRAEIGKLRSTNKFIENDPEAARNTMLAEIHKKVKAHGIPDAQYREYLLAEFGVNSAGLLEIGQLQQFRDYIRNSGRCIPPKPKEKTVFERREESLRALMQERGGEAFSSIDDAQAQLVRRDPALFSDLALETFQLFWKKQKATKLKRGRRAYSLEAPTA